MATPQFDFFPRDFLASTIGWPAAARGHYITLLCVAWEQEGLPGDPRKVAAISPGLADEWPEWEEKFPVGEDGRRRNPRLERERAYRLSKSEAGKAGADARWGTDGKNGKRNGTRIEFASSSHAVSHMANDMAKRCPPSPAPSPSLGEIQPAAPDATSEPPKRRKRSQPTDSISWDASGGWQGITDADRQAWATAYPAVDLARELAAAGEWLKANPEKARKSRWRAFVTRWLSRSQERGGGRPSARPGLPGSPMTLDEKLERDRRERASKPAWRKAPPGCPDDLAGRFFNQMLSEEQFEKNLALARQEHSQRLQEAASGPEMVVNVPPVAFG